MEEKLLENNNVLMMGKIVSDLQFSHEICGEKFYLTKIETTRSSGNKDCIPLMISERLINVNDLIGKLVNVTGQFRSHNFHDGSKSKLELFVFAKEIEVLDELKKSENKICLEGYICKGPKYRLSPLGREITDIVLAVNRINKKSDYIPCIFWERNARFVSTLDIGSHIKITGRVQSREYRKKINENENEVETRTAYEVSATAIYILED